MADNWYYVQKGNRQGPVSVRSNRRNDSEEKEELKPEDYIWKKGFENWKKIKEVDELKVHRSQWQVPPMPEVPETPEVELALKSFNPDERSAFIRIGTDRGEASFDYGPFTIKQLKQLYDEKRINGKTFVFIKGMKDFKILGRLLRLPGVL
ncbi:MAG: GYF domain-containing protein [Chitinophagaceae bacterium]